MDWVMPSIGDILTAITLTLLLCVGVWAVWFR